MNILILGSGGREHALAWKMAASPLADKLYCAPGNAGIAREAECVALDLTDHAAVIAFCQIARHRPGAWSGPSCHCAPASSTIWRPPASRRSARANGRRGWKAPKGFTKDLCKANKIPTAAYERFKRAAPAKDYVRKHGAPIVVKADGLAAGKGVVVAETVAEAEAAIDMMFDGGLGAAGLRNRHRGLPDRRGGLVLRAVRRRDRDRAGIGAGPQARRRRRQRSQHRRHGRLFAGARHDAGNERSA